MEVTRRQGLIAMGATLVGIALNGFFFGRLRPLTALLRARHVAGDGRADNRAGRRPSRRVEPAPHSVKRHG